VADGAALSVVGADLPGGAVGVAVADRGRPGQLFDLDLGHALQQLALFLGGVEGGPLLGAYHLVGASGGQDGEFGDLPSAALVEHGGAVGSVDVGGMLLGGPAGEQAALLDAGAGCLQGGGAELVGLGGDVGFAVVELLQLLDLAGEGGVGLQCLGLSACSASARRLPAARASSALPTAVIPAAPRENTCSDMRSTR